MRFSENAKMQLSIDHLCHLCDIENGNMSIMSSFFTQDFFIKSRVNIPAVFARGGITFGIN